MKNLTLLAIITLTAFAIYGCATTGASEKAAAVPMDVEVDAGGTLMKEWFYGNWYNGNANNPITITVNNNSLIFKNEANTRSVLVNCSIDSWGEEEIFVTDGAAGSFRAIKITGTIISKDKWNSPGDYMVALFGEGDGSGPITAWLGCKQPEDLTRSGAGMNLLSIQRDGVTKAAFWRNLKRQ